MKALVTGASSGLGRDMAHELANRGVGLILTARRVERLEELKKELPTTVRIVPADLSSEDGVRALYEAVRHEDVDILINNAGLGLFGEFTKTDLNRELNLIDLNIRATHMLTKLFLKDFVKRGKGSILNVASSAAFLPGPNMAAYYASKAYVLRLTEGIREELRRAKSPVYIGVLCPGPVRTEFSSVADVEFTIPSLSSEKVASIAIRGMLRRKMIIVPGLRMKLAHFGERFLPDTLLARFAYGMQKSPDELK